MQNDLIHFFTNFQNKCAELIGSAVDSKDQTCNLEEKVYLACDETNWLIMTETENQEKGLKLEMAMGGVWQGWDPWFEPIRRQFFEVNVKSKPENELCGRHKYIQWMFF